MWWLRWRVLPLCWVGCWLAGDDLGKYVERIKYSDNRSRIFLCVFFWREDFFYAKLVGSISRYTVCTERVESRI